MKNKWALLFVGLLVLAVVVPALFWWGTWFGVRLNDAVLEEYLADGAKPRHVQHAVEEITRRLDEVVTTKTRSRASVDPWARRLVEVSRRDDPTVRLTCAWGMQYDPGRPEFIERLREMVLEDDAELVRRNAATSLAASGDATGRPVLLRMLEPFPIAAPVDGVARSVPSIGRFVREREVIMTIDVGDGEVAELLAELPGTVTQVAVEVGGEVAAGEDVITLSAAPDQVRNAVLALLKVGAPADLDALALVASERSGYEPSVRRVAEAAIAAIEARSEK